LVKTTIGIMETADRPRKLYGVDATTIGRLEAR
jgi:hypothetical protein